MPGIDNAAQASRKALTKLLARVDAQATPASVISLSYALAEWLRGAELEAGTRGVNAAWVAASDRKAAEILGSRMPRRRSASGN